MIWSLWADTITGYDGSQYQNNMVIFQSKIWLESMIIVAIRGWVPYSEYMKDTSMYGRNI